MGSDPSDDDPGWPSLGRVLLMLVPGYLQLRMTRERDQLVALRAVFLSFSLSLVLFAIVLQSLSNPGPNRVMPWLALLVVGAAVSTVGIRVAVKRLDCSSESKLAASYRTRFFVTMAFSQSVALYAFCFAFIGAPTWIYDLGGAFSIVRMWTLDPPTRARLRQHQAALASSGCQLSLVAALRGSPRA